MINDKKPLTPQQAMNRAAALCARSEQAASDLREKMMKWGLTPDEATRVLQQLTQQGFIDEGRYARAFVKDKFTFNGWGRIKIAHQLRQKGIAAATIDGAMLAIDDDTYRQRLLELLRSKWRTVQGKDPRTAWAAMMRFAASRGFEATLASDCVKQVTRLDVEDD